MVRVDNRNIEAIRAENKARRDAIKAGDISEALRSYTDAEKQYAHMTEAFRCWAEATRGYESARRASVDALEAFNRNAEELLGGSMRMHLVACEAVVKPDEVNLVTDDSLWTALLGRIANTDTIRAIQMTSAAFKIACETLGSYKSKLIGLERKTQLKSGATEAEQETARKLMANMNLAIEIIDKRRAVAVELNLRYRRVAEKFIKEHTVDGRKARSLTKAEKEALKGLI